MAYSFTHPTPEQLAFLSDNLRAQDRVELEAAQPGANTLELLTHSVAISETAICVLHEGEPVAVLGVARETTQGWGIPWMLGTEKVKRHARLALEMGSYMTGQWAVHYGLLIQYVHKDNSLSLNWLKRMGFREVDTRGVFITVIKEG